MDIIPIHLDKESLFTFSGPVVGGEGTGGLLTNGWSCIFFYLKAFKLHI